MEQREPDPFFEQLKKDIQEGVDAADRGEFVDAEEVWRSLYDRVDEIERTADSTR